MATVRDNLVAARALIDTPEKWLRYDLRNDDFTCFCALGAVESAANYVGSIGFFSSPEVSALANELGSKSWTTVSSFNDSDTTTHADIMALFDRAIEASE